MLVGLFSRVKNSKSFLFSVHFYVSQKFSVVFKLMHAFVAASVVRLQSSVSLVLARRSQPQICPPIVGSVEIDVVNFKIWPTSCDVQPSEPVRHIVNSINSNFYSNLRSRFVNKPGEFSCGCSLRQSFYPFKFSCFYGVFQNRPQKVRRNWRMRIFVTSHPETFAAMLIENPLKAFRGLVNRVFS